MTARALRSLPPLADLPPVVETLRALVGKRWIESRLYHDHAERVRAARAAQRIGYTETTRAPWHVPNTTRTTLPTTAPLWYNPSSLTPDQSMQTFANLLLAELLAAGALDISAVQRLRASLELEVKKADREEALDRALGVTK